MAFHHAPKSFEIFDLDIYHAICWFRFYLSVFHGYVVSLKNKNSLFQIIHWHQLVDLMSRRLLFWDTDIKLRKFVYSNFLLCSIYITDISLLYFCIFLFRAYLPQKAEMKKISFLILEFLIIYSINFFLFPNVFSLG